MTIANLTRTFGVEMEVNTTRRANTLVNAMNAEFENRGIEMTATASPRTMNDTAWVVKNDPTVSPGWEVVSPPMTLVEGKAQIAAVCAALQGLDCYITRQAGLHVHHDVRDLTGEQVGKAFGIYATFQDLFSRMVAPSRRPDSAGRRAYNSAISWDRITNGGRDKFADDRRSNATTRYRTETIEGKIQSRVAGRSVTMNINAVFAHGTIEFRQHQGSINAEKIWSWVLITQSVIETAIQGTYRNVKPTSMIRAEGKPNAFRKRGEFARFREFVGVAPYQNGVPSGAEAGEFGTQFDARIALCTDYYEKAFRYFARVVKKFNGNRTY